MTNVSELLARRRKMIVESKALCLQSRLLITTSRGLTRRFCAPIGASDAHDPTIQGRIARTLKKTRSGALPSAFDGKLWAGRGSFAVCSGCGDKISSEEAEYEVELAEALTFRFHAPCYHAWKTLPANN
jgi:hypothetical protein